MLSAIFIMCRVVAFSRGERKHPVVLVLAAVPHPATLRMALLLSGCCLLGTAPARAEGDSPRPAAGAKRKHERPAKKPIDSAAARRAARLGLGTRAVAGKLLAGHAERAWLRAAGGETQLPGTLRTPVARGWFVRGFGSGEAGYHQAIDIGGEIGWSVRAAAAGLVGYAGDELDGYGNLVILIHPGGFITIYAHNSKNRVVPGQRVDRGAVIAELGSTGRSKGPHVHFELLFSGENCDPAPLLRPGLRHKNQKAIDAEKASWRKPQQRPRAIVCHGRKHHPDYVDRPQPEELNEDVAPPEAEAP